MGNTEQISAEINGTAASSEKPLNKVTSGSEAKFDKIVQNLLERKGKFQIVVIGLLCLNSIVIGINHTITTFHIYVPNFNCRDNADVKCGHYENGTECPSGYKFDEEDDHSVAVEFQTVCNRAMFAPMINSLYFVGVTLGALICSTLCDIYGRYKLVVICLYGQALMALGQYFAGGLYIFSLFRLAQGFFIQGLQTCSYTLMLEYCPSRHRTVVATYWEANWAIGLGILGGVSYFIRNWRLVTLVLAAPALLSLAYIWLFPESIVWLEAKGRRREALKLVKKIAKFNGDTDIYEEVELIALTEQDAESKRLLSNENHSSQPTTSVEKISLSIIIKNIVLRKHLLSMICVWFSVTLSYYGILYFLPNLAGQRHLNFEIGALIELIAYILAYFILSRFGRRIPMAFYQYANGVLILLIAVLTVLPKGSYSGVWLIMFTLFAKGFAVSSFCGMFIYCSELLPTVCRGLGLGLCGFSARCGSLLAPQLMALVSIMPAFIPLSVMSVMLLITATVTLCLPETLSTILPNTIMEADRIWSKKH